MKHTFLLGLVCLGLLLPAPGVLPAAAATNPIPESADFQVSSPEHCDLPAVQNFHVTDVGTNYISLAWDSVASAQQYFLVALNAGSSKVAASLYTSSTSATIYVPGPGAYDLQIAPVAGEGCPPSANKVTIPNVLVLIVDLINIGYSPVCIEPLGLSNGCVELPWGVDRLYWFDVTLGNSTLSRYMIDFKGNGCDVAVARLYGPATTPFAEMFSGSLGIQYIPVPPNPDQHNVINIWIRNSVGQDIYKVETTFDGNKLRVCVVKLAGEYNLRFWQTCNSLPSDPNPPGGGDQRSTSETADAAVIVQNPFAEELRVVDPGLTTSGPVTLRLFSLDGRTVASETSPARQEYILPTAGLPAGLYLLRLENEGVYRTFKVVKNR